MNVLEAVKRVADDNLEVRVNSDGLRAGVEPTVPSKEAIRGWLFRRSQCREPLPEPEQLRQELGWRLA